MGKDRWYSQMEQVETGCSKWDRWDWDRGVSIMRGTGWDWVGQGGLQIRWDWDRWVFRLGGTGWDWDRGSSS